MIYRIATYDRTTDRMKGNLPIPSSVLKQIKRIAGFGPNDDGRGEYPLDEAQTRVAPTPIMVDEDGLPRPFEPGKTRGVSDHLPIVGRLVLSEESQ